MHKYRFDPAPANTHRLLLEAVPAGSRVLEIGTASGYLGEYLIKEKNCEVWGVEPFAEAYQEAMKCGYTRLFNKSVEEFLADNDGVPEKFDVILLGDVLEHLVAPAVVLRQLTRQLQPAGICVISLPNIAHYSIRKDLLLGRWAMSDAGILDRTHLHFYNQAGMIELIKSAGLDIVSVRPSGGYLERFLRRFGQLGKRLLFAAPRVFAFQFIITAKLPANH